MLNFRVLAHHSFRARLPHPDTFFKCLRLARSLLFLLFRVPSAKSIRSSSSSTWIEFSRVFEFSWLCLISSTAVIFWFLLWHYFVVRAQRSCAFICAAYERLECNIIRTRSLSRWNFSISSRRQTFALIRVENPSVAFCFQRPISLKINAR